MQTGYRVVMLQNVPGRTLASAIKHAQSLLSRFPFLPRVTSGDAILNVLELRQNVLPSGSRVFFDEDLTVQLRRLFYLLSSARKANGRLPQLTFQLAWLQSAPTVTPQKKPGQSVTKGKLGAVWKEMLGEKRATPPRSSDGLHFCLTRICQVSFLLTLRTPPSPTPFIPKL